MLFGFLGYSIACQPCSRPSKFFTTFVLHSFALLDSYLVNDSLLLHCLCYMPFVASYICYSFICWTWVYFGKCKWMVVAGRIFYFVTNLDPCVEYTKHIYCKENNVFGARKEREVYLVLESKEEEGGAPQKIKLYLFKTSFCIREIIYSVMIFLWITYICYLMWIVSLISCFPSFLPF